jgi:hypothetical protein
VRYFVRVERPFGPYQPGSRVCFEEHELHALRPGLVAVEYGEQDGQRVEVGGAGPAVDADVAAPKSEDFPVDTLTDAERGEVVAALPKGRRKKD